MHDSRVYQQHRVVPSIQDHLQRSLDDLISDRFPICQRGPEGDAEVDLPSGLA